MTDFIIVGRGLAASTLMHAFHKQHITFITIGNKDLSSSSRVAAGIWNPIVFKRLTKSWLADELIPYLNEFYADCELRLGKKLVTQRPIVKPFTEDQEKVLWDKKAADELKNFLEPISQHEEPEEFKQCIITNGIGYVKNSGNLNMTEFLDQTADYFEKDLLEETFDHSQLKVYTDKVVYRGIEARQIIFCEGHLVKNNPFFNWIPLKPAKGEVFTVKIPQLQFVNAIFNRNGFVMDLGDGLYKVGATYAWDDLTEDLTEAGALELNDKLKKMTDCQYEVTRHEAGIRPSSSDRRPIIGQHPLHKNLFVFNGLGTKGVMLAPFFAGNFVNFYLQKEDINREVDVKRFYHLYEEKK